ncbi:hypothetical protein Nepgr_014986 [Nepenthes gracilis]|uniref:Stress-related protein n=1 Tax=Nepenthes gracilis TaxID=150966 RepID=A0AAD3SKA0_NEPGR|nr:hypothetical protein Nepgr_014986 [Nepenthes gracilis]
MADGDSRFEQRELAQSEELRLKYLAFVHAAALHAVVCFSTLYVYARDKSGPLKPGVEAVESTVKTVVGPVYDKFHDVPIEFLKFVDQKMDESLSKLEQRLPPAVRQASFHAFSAAQKAPEVARTVASEVQRAGVVDTASGIAKNMYAKYEPTAKELYSKCEPVAEQYAALAWRSLNRLPLFPQVAQVMVPTAAYCSDMYNKTVLFTAEKGYKVANYLPLVPTHKISRVFRPTESEFQPLDSHHSESAVAAH